MSPAGLGSLRDQSGNHRSPHDQNTQQTPADTLRSRRTLGGNSCTRCDFNRIVYDVVTIGIPWVEIVVLSDYNRIVYDVVTIGIPWVEIVVLSDYNIIVYDVVTIGIPWVEIVVLSDYNLGLYMMWLQ